MKLQGLFLRLTLSIGSAIGVGVISAVIVAVVDLYLVGHGYGSLLQEFITWASGDVHLSPGDLVVLIASVLSGYLTWHLLNRGT